MAFQSLQSISPLSPLCPRPALAQLLETHPQLCSLPEDQKPSLSRVLAIRTPDLESQDHIFEVPSASGDRKT